MTDQSQGGIFIVNPETGEAEAITSEELAAAKAAPAPVKPNPRKPHKTEELTDAVTN
jgi:hypothetical protein